MAFINYENLPSENTPLTGGSTGNLNVMQENGTSHGTDTKLGYAQSFLNDHLVNVSNEVDEDYRVNLLETKNLFTITSVLPNTALNNNVVFSSSEWDIFVIPVEIGTTYTLSKTSYNGGILSFNTTFPKIDDTVNNAQTLRNISTLTFEAKDNYLCLMIAKSDGKTTIQVEKGSTATTYSPFIQNQIVVDNEKYSDTLNVGASVDSRSRVNVLHSKNLYDVNTMPLTNGLWYGTNQISTNNTGNYVVVPIIGGKTYTISKKNSGRIFTTTTATYPANGVATIDTWGGDTSLTKRTITTSTNAKYLFIGLLAGASPSASDIATAIEELQVEEGSTQTTYEPYITPSIYVDNEMLVSKNVYSTSEVVIGEWFGKPLYRKVIDCGNLPNATTKSITHNISNLDKVINMYGSCSYGGNIFPLPYVATGITSQIGIYCNSTSFVISAGGDRTNYTGYAVLEYTKTTD